MNWQSLDPKKGLLDRLRPLKPALLQNLEDWFRVELTYTSNAIEGNTLTRQETAVVLEKGITVGGRTMREHLEAINHAAALDRLKEVLANPRRIAGEREILHLHELIMKGVDDANAGRYRTVMVRIAGSRVAFPNSRKVPDLMAELASWLKSPSTLHAAERAAQAHYRLVSIHPFVDGNGRTARLLMNLLLMQGGFPPVFTRPRERLTYLNGLEKAQLGGSMDDYSRLTMKIIDRSLEIYLKAAKGKSPDARSGDAENRDSLLRIGALAKATGEGTVTLRHWTKEGLLKPVEFTESGYTLYSAEAVRQVKRIRELQGKRLTLEEIKRELEQM